MMNRETLFTLRRITAEYPYYQTARLLLLKNLYLLHDATFDEELRRAAIYFTDRRILFNLVEAAHYRLKRRSPQSFSNVSVQKTTTQETTQEDSRTVSLIDNFLSSIPEDAPEKESKEVKKEHRKPTAVDATTDYVAYLLSTDFEELDQPDSNTDAPSTDILSADSQQGLHGGDLIDAFIENEGKITLQETLEYTPDTDSVNNDTDDVPSDEYLTETLAGIYIKQGQYRKALEIMERLNTKTGKEGRYFEDQKRFLNILIANQK